MKAQFLRTLKCLCLSGLVTAPWAQIINITGRVTDQDANPVAGAEVRLASGRTVSTDAQGYYTLDGELGGVRGPDGNVVPGSSPIFNNSMLEFKVLADKADVRIEVFNLIGTSVAILLDATLERGKYEINTLLPGFNSQVLFLKADIGDRQFIYKMFNDENGALQHSLLNRSSLPRTAALAKTAAVIDTIYVAKPTYSDAKQLIETLEGTYDFTIVNTDWFWGGDPHDFPVANNVVTYVFLNRTNGAYTDDQIYWSFAGQNHTIAEAPTYDMGANSSGRVNMHLGSANGEYWDFTEHTISATNWYGNTTRVDGWRLPIAIRLVCEDGTDEMLGEVYQVFYMGREKFFQAYKDAVPDEFDACADNGYPQRIIAPGKGEGVFRDGQAHEDYFDAYLAELGINGATTNQVFACEGNPFGSQAQLAGAVNRHVAHLPESEWNNPENYYQQAPANYYAKFMHDWSFQNKAYGFAYDDAAGMAAYTACRGPQYMITAVGY